MLRIHYLTTLAAAVGLGVPVCRAADSAPPVPVTRPEMKQALEALKKATPRLPLPPFAGGDSARPGGRSPVYNGWSRQVYLPAELRGGDFAREPDPGMTLDPTFKTMLFWIVSRVNNCHY